MGTLYQKLWTIQLTTARQRVKDHQQKRRNLLERNGKPRVTYRGRPRAGD
jgi:hypothetical protein